MLLEKALESVLLQSFPQEEFEIIVADNGSSDCTKALCNAYKSRFSHFKYFFDETPGLHVGRHRGLKEAASDILVYADDDIQALPSWLEAIWASFQDPAVMLVGGNNYPLYEHEPPAWMQRLWDDSATADGRCYGYLSILDFGSEEKGIDPQHVFGCNFSIRKNILLEAGGFHPDSMPQELIRFRGDGETAVSEYLQNKSYTAVFNPQASVRHAVTRERMTREYLKKRSFNQGISDSFTALRAGDPGGPAPDAGTPHEAADSIPAGIGRAVKALGRGFSSRIFGDIHQDIRAAYLDGYNYHQKQYRSDPEVRAWVHRMQYYE